MGDYNEYAQKFDNFAMTRFAEYIDAKSQFETAEKKANSFGNIPPTDYEALAAKSRATAAYNEAKGAFEQAKKKLINSDIELAKLREELESELAVNFRARPQDLDRDVLTLLDADVLNPADVKYLLDDANQTMRRIILKYVSRKADEAEQSKDTENARAFNVLRHQIQSDSPSNYLRVFDELVDIFVRTTQNTSMIPHWHELVEPLLEVF